MKPLLLTLACAVICAPAAFAQPDPHSVLQQARQSSNGGQSVQGQVVLQPIGQSNPGKSAALLQNAAKLVMQDADDVIHFVNDNGCVPGRGGSYTELNKNALQQVVNQSAAQTEVLFNVGQGMMTRLTGVSSAWAVGITKEIKPALEKSQGLKLGTAGKNVIVLKVMIDGNDGGARFAHEFLHIVLRQLDNPGLGGGAYKGKECPFIAITHHELTDFLAGKGDPNGAAPKNPDSMWSQYKQSPKTWTPSPANQKPACKAPDMTDDDHKCGDDSSGAAGTAAPSGGSSGGSSGAPSGQGQ